VPCTCSCSYCDDSFVVARNGKMVGREGKGSCCSPAGKNGSRMGEGEEGIAGN
jgi:hypothetical protein